MNASLIRFSTPPSHLDPQALEFIPTPAFPSSFTIVQTPIYYPYQYPSTVSPDYSLNSGGLPVIPFYPSTTSATVISSGSSSMAQFCPYQVPRENPSRTLLLSLVPPDINEVALTRELEFWGPVRALQIERLQQQGTVMVHYFDIRHAQRALSDIQQQHLLQQSRLGQHYSMLRKQASEGDNSSATPPILPPAPRLLAPVNGQARGLIGGCAVWAQFAVPTCGSFSDSHNQGTLVVFNLDSDVSAISLKEIFESFGPVKELRETPSKRQHRFVEFFDVRDAARALSEMNGQEIGGKRVKIEYSRPGGQARRFCNTTTASSIAQRTTTNLPQQPPRKINSQERLWQHLESSVQSYSHSHRRGMMGRGNGALTYLPRLTYRPSSSNSNAHQTQYSRSPKQEQPGPRSFPAVGGCGKNSRNGTRFIFDESKAQSNSGDPRTTVMIKNIPNKYSQKLLLSMLDQHCISSNEKITDANEPLSAYDFVYLPIDFKNKCNVGYGFVNFTSAKATWKLYKAFHMQPWEAFNSRKICEVTYARLQGIDALKDHFKNSKFACDTDEYMPVIFFPPRDGKLLSEPLAIGGHTSKKTNQQERKPNDDGDSAPQPPQAPPPSQMDGSVHHDYLINNDTVDYDSPSPEIHFPAVTVTVTCSLDSETQQQQPKSLSCTQVS